MNTPVWLRIIVLLAAQANLTWILGQSQILNWPRNQVKRVPFLKELFDCPRCLGFWTTGIVLLLPDWMALWLAVAQLGHVLYQALETYLPCPSCKIQQVDDFKII